jgi:hypothetical protein
MSKYIELYSGNRNRNLYPEPASYQIPFSSTLQNINPGESKDPVVDGAIYYTFTLYPQNDDYRITGSFQPGTNAYNLYLDPNQSDISGNRGYSFINNFFKGYVIYKASDVTFSEPRYIRSFDPATGLVKIDKPFISMSLPEQYYMWQGFPTDPNYLYIPTVDDNYNFINTSELAYNGYYIVFETPNPNYSNSDNSNIFYRKISYYDNIYQIAYYNEPLPFTYNVIEDPPQKFTIRKSLPFERWTLPVTSRYNTVSPANKIIGPLIGPVITLPSNASNIDNYYTGKFVYFANNIPETYKGIYPQPLDSFDPISNNIFYPVYGLYYIKAYNGNTKELSVCYDRGKYKEYPLPIYKGIGYNIYYFVAGAGISSYNTYLTYSEIIFDNLAPYTGEISFDPQDYILPGKTYSVSITLKDTSIGKELGFTTFTVNDNGTPIYTSPPIKKSSNQTVNFTITPTTTNLTLLFTYIPDPADLATQTYSVAFYNIYFGGMAYDSSSITSVSGISSLSQISPQEYKATFDNIAPYEGVFSIQPQFVSRTGDPPDKYNISWCLKTFGTFTNPVYFQVLDGINPIYTSSDITSNYSCITFSITPSTTPSNITFLFYYDSTSSAAKGIQWNYFFVLDQTIQETPILNYATSVNKPIGMNIIDISNFYEENFNPLSYNGTMIGVEQTVCYKVSLLSLTLPNVLLKTGSRIAFYPYVYVEFSNATTPNGASNQIIYSNNPNSERALFIAPVTQLLQPEAKTFITLRGGGMSQLIKFKPNDNLKFSVYLPDGSLFETLDIDTLPPYDPQLGLQIDAVFSISRDNQSTSQAMISLSIPQPSSKKK